MSDIFQIVNAKESKLDFQLVMEGISPKDLNVNLCLHTDKYNLAFPCEKKSGDKWICNVPALEHLEKGQYKFHIEAVGDGYYFEAMKGNVDVTGTHAVYAKAPDKLKPEEGKKVKENLQQKKEEPKVELKEPEAKKNLSEVESIANDILKGASKVTKPAEVTAPKKEVKPIVEDTKPASTLKDEAVRNILGLDAKKIEKTFETKKSSRKIFTKGKVISS